MSKTSAYTTVAGSGEGGVALLACLSDQLLDAAQQVLEAARKAGMTLGCAESCTGGLIAAALTGNAGASTVFRGGVVSYDPSVKQDLLGVDESLIVHKDLVSQECAVQMAQGAQSALGADVAVSATGIAGPGGAEPGKPVGTVWIALAHPAGTSAQCFCFSGDRNAVRCAAALAALQLLKEAL